VSQDKNPIILYQKSIQAYNLNTMNSGSLIPYQRSPRIWIHRMRKEVEGHLNGLVIQFTETMDHLFARLLSNLVISHHDEIRKCIMICEKNYQEERERMMNELYQKSKQALDDLANDPVATASEVMTEHKSHIQTIFDELKKNTRLTTREFIQMKSDLERLESGLTAAHEQLVNERLAEKERQIKRALKQKTDIMLKLFDLLDETADTIKQLNHQPSYEVIQSAVKDALTTLFEHGIKEMDVKGQIVDSSRMITIGTVSSIEIDEPLQKYQVYKVYKRGFILDDGSEHAGEVLRKATVISVLD
jgi:hypothetical protein